jgi:hypothetical protein
MEVLTRLKEYVWRKRPKLWPDRKNKISVTISKMVYCSKKIKQFAICKISIMKCYRETIHNLPSFLAASAFWSIVCWPAVAVFVPPDDDVSVPTEPVFRK